LGGPPFRFWNGCVVADLQVGAFDFRGRRFEKKRRA
jgi:hypothetical protein